MNGIDKITERITAQTREEIAVMQEEMAGKCREIEEAYDKLAKEEYQKIVTAGAKDCELQMQRLAGTAAMESKKNILSMKQEAVDKILALAAERICTLPEDEYVRFLARLAGEAASTGSEEVVFSSRDKAEVSKAVIKAANDILKKRGIEPRLSVSEVTGSFMGGLIIKQGDIEVNCSVSKLLELSRDNLAGPVAEILFSD